MNDRLAGFERLYRDADDLAPRVPVAVAGAADETVLQAIRQATDRHWIQPMLFGDEREVRAIADKGQVDVSDLQIVDSQDAAVSAVAEVHRGAAPVLMKGQIPTPDLMRAVLDQDRGLRTGHAIAQVVLMSIHRDRRQFLLADTGIHISPTLEQKIDIMRQTVTIASGLGCAKPRVAWMAASEKVTAKMPETVEADKVAQRARSGEFSGCEVSGPLSFDMAYSPDAAAKKTPNDPVMGKADVMLFPNLVSANLTVKAMMYTAECRFGGLLVGVACPVVFMSRADTTETRLNSLAFALRGLEGGWKAEG